MKNEEWLTPVVFLTSLLFILPSNAGNTVAASLYYNTADNKTTRQQNYIYYFIIILQSLSWKMRDSATGESVLMMEKMYQWPSEPMR